MRCQHHSNKLCNDCDEFLISCNDCEHLDGDGDCYNSESENYCECMQDIAICCNLFEQVKEVTNAS